MSVARPCAAVVFLAAFAATICVRVAFAPIRWGLASLTGGPPAEDDPDGYVWWRDDVDVDESWAELRVAPDPLVSHNGKH